MSDQSAELSQLISKTLRTGVLGAMGLGLAGGALYLLTIGSTAVSFHHFAGAQTAYTSLGKIFANAVAGPSRAVQGEAIAETGILLLMLTPIARVVLSLVTFVGEKDLTFALLTTLVLLFLIGSMLLH